MGSQKDPMSKRTVNVNSLHDIARGYVAGDEIQRREMNSRLNMPVTQR